PDGLRVAAAFEVEDAAVAPSVFVVADELARRIARERRLARAREAEEERDISRGADVGGAVHREDVFEREDVVQDAEDRLLHLAGVAGAADEDELLREIERDDDFGARAMTGRVGLETRRVDDRELGRPRGGGR